MRPLLALLLSCAVLTACQKRPVASADLRLPTLAAGEASPGACPAERCLTVYVAPWCGICRVSTPLLKAVRERLAARGVPVRFIVGKDSPEAVRAYAAEFGPETMLDLSAEVPLRGGVPNFTVLDSSGTVLKSVAGVPALHRPPFSQELLDGFTAFLGL